MWKNLVGPTGEEVVTTCNVCVAGEFGQVVGYAGDPLTAPALPPGGLIASWARST